MKIPARPLYYLRKSRITSVDCIRVEKARFATRPLFGDGWAYKRGYVFRG